MVTLSKRMLFFQVPGKQLDLPNFTSEVSFSLVHNNKAILPSKRGRGRPRVNENISYDSPNSSVLSLDLSIDESCSRQENWQIFREFQMTFD